MTRYAMQDRPDGSVEIVELRPVTIATFADPGMAQRFLWWLGSEKRPTNGGEAPPDAPPEHCRRCRP